MPGQEPANVDFQRQLGSYARKLIAFFTWYPRTTPESPMTGRTETWFDDHPEREQIAAVLIDYFLNGLGLEWIEQQLERFSSGALWYESGYAGTLLHGWMAEPKWNPPQNGHGC